MENKNLAPHEPAVREGTPTPSNATAEPSAALLDAAQRFLAVNDEFDRRRRMGDAFHILALAGVQSRPAADLRKDGEKAMADMRAAIAKATGADQ